MRAVLLEDFDTSVPVSPAAAGAPPPPLTEADRIAAYERGYQAGWDDAAQAQAADQTRIGAEFARSLQEVSFTFHEARAHLLHAMEPLLEQIATTLLPALVHETFAQTILEELQPLIEASADAPVELVVAPAGRAALEKQLAEIANPAIRLAEEPSLGEGQAYLRVGKTERQIDMASALQRITAAIRSLHQLNERTLKHA